jgi:hypothetical protein
MRYQTALRPDDRFITPRNAKEERLIAKIGWIGIKIRL